MEPSMLGKSISILYIDTLIDENESEYKGLL